MRPGGANEVLLAATLASLLTAQTLAAPAPPVCSDPGTDPLWSALAAATVGDTLCLQRLLDRGLDAESRTRQGESLLGAAATYAHPDAVRLLLDRGASPDGATRFAGSPSTPLRISLSLQHWPVAELLLERGAAADAALPYSTSARAVDLLLERGGHLAAEAEPDHLTALAHAVRLGDAGLVGHLLDRGADLEQRALGGMTPLQIAVANRDPEMTRVLLDRGARLAAPAPGGGTALALAVDPRGGWHASIREQPGLVRLLLERGADPDERTADGTPLKQVAARLGFAEVAALLAHRAHR